MAQSSLASNLNELHHAEFVQLLTSHQEAMQLFVYSLLPNHPDFMDLVQEVNITLWEKRDQFELGTNFGAWWRQIARNKVMNHNKKLKRAGMLVFDDSLLEQMESEMTEPSPEEFEMTRQALNECFGQLAPKNQSLLQARYNSPDGMARYSAASGRSHESLRVTLCRVRDWLRNCIDQRLTPGGDI
jgi:RNA polymerase sigma-70 factor (ECF subfamily)